MEKQATQPLIEPPSPDKELGHRRDKKNSPFELANCPKHPVLVAGAAIAVLLAAVFGFNTMKLRNRRPSTELKPVVAYTETFKAEDTGYLTANLLKSIRISTVSFDQKDEVNPGVELIKRTAKQLIQFDDFLTKTFPDVMNKTVRKPFIRLVNDDVQYCISSRPAILLWVIGSNKSLAPYLLNAHMDVVPAERRWRPLNIDPFKPQLIREENVTFLYGRGALDNKNNFMSILEVLHRLDRPPQRGFYVAFSHDKEANSRTSGSVELAKCVNTLLKKDYNGKKLVLVMDEGLMVMNRSMPMVNRPIAFVGVEEKGLLRVKIKATTHRNRRPFTRVSEESAVIRLARAVSRFKHDVHPTIMTDFVRAMIWHVAPYASFPYNMVLANMWLFRPLLEMLMANEDNTSGFVRTTTAVTIIRGGLLDTVVPEVAEAFVTHCVLPELSVAETLRRDCEILGNINNVTAAVDNWIPPVERNPLGRQKLGYTELPKDVGFVALQESIGAVFPFAIVVPSLMTTPTASRYYVNLTRYIYRFSPLNIDVTDLSGIHGSNERISVEQYRKMCNFYWHFVKTMDKLGENANNGDV